MEMTLTKEQQEIVDSNLSYFLVRACPGSGKTYTLASKATLDIKEWSESRRGMALISFTNTAKLELQDEIERISGSTVAYPHYVGTIDSFINKYLFFPYIDLLGFDAGKISMVGEPYTRNYSYSRKQKCAILFKYEVNGNYIVPSRHGDDVYDEKTVTDAKRVKYAMIKDHKFTQADANYYALRILQEHEYIRDEISDRFPYVYLDEAQDTTPIHWEIIKLITQRDSNVRFGVIGDPDQSIYGWNGAKPKLFIDYEKKLAETGRVLYLNDCRRSSQAICDFYFKFSTLEKPPRAIDEKVSDLNLSPEVIFYNSLEELSDITRKFREKFRDEETLILTRSSKIVDIAARLDTPNPEAVSLNPFSSSVPYKSLIARSALNIKADYDSNRYADALYRAEAFYLRNNNIYDKDKFLEESGLRQREWYSLLESDIVQMPHTDLKLGEWATAAEEAKMDTIIFRDTTFKPKRKAKIDYASTRAADFFMDAGAAGVESIVDTVHSAKGKTTDHVLVLMDDKQSKRLVNVLSGKNVDDTEEKRVFYVAISRARKTITLCLPKEYEKRLKGKI